MEWPCLHSLRGFLRSEKGVSAVEFAFVFPTLLVLMLAGIQLVTYANAVRKVEQLASSISEMISQAAPPNASTTVATVNAADLHFSSEAALVVFPYVMKDAARQNLAWWQDISIDYSSIQFTQLSTACAAKADKSACYLAKVVWTSTGTTGTNKRPCIVPQLPADDKAPPANTTLPRSVFGAGSLIAVDVVFTFQPTFGSAFLKPLRIARSVFVQPRYASVINYDTTNDDGIASKCLG